MKKTFYVLLSIFLATIFKHFLGTGLKTPEEWVGSFPHPPPTDPGFWRSQGEDHRRGQTHTTHLVTPRGRRILARGYTRPVEGEPVGLYVGGIRHPPTPLGSPGV